MQVYGPIERERWGSKFECLLKMNWCLLTVCSCVSHKSLNQEKRLEFTFVSREDGVLKMFFKFYNLGLNYSDNALHWAITDRCSLLLVWWKFWKIWFSDIIYAPPEANWTFRSPIGSVGRWRILSLALHFIH